MLWKMEIKLISSQKYQYQLCLKGGPYRQELVRQYFNNSAAKDKRGLWSTTRIGLKEAREELSLFVESYFGIHIHILIVVDKSIFKVHLCMLQVNRMFANDSGKKRWILYYVSIVD